MKTMLALAALLAVGGCAGMDLDRMDDSGLAPPPGGSIIPEPHPGAEEPSRYLTNQQKATPPRERYPVPKPKD